MNDLFRAIFGLTRNEDNGKRMDDRRPEDHRNNFGGHAGDDDNDDFDNDDSMRMGPRGGIFGFPLFNDPSQIHKHFEKLVSEMNKAFGVFGFSSEPSITWGGESSSMSPFSSTEPRQEQESLRDSYLKKPDCMCNTNHRRDDFSSNISIRTNDFAPHGLETPISYSKSYSVFIQTVRKPDGTVETIKKVKDHTGNEKTTITQSNVSEPIPPPQDDQLMPPNDTSGISIFKKFFSF